MGRRAGRDVARVHFAPPGLGQVRRANPVKVMSIRTPRMPGVEPTDHRHGGLTTQWTLLLQDCGFVCRPAARLFRPAGAWRDTARANPVKVMSIGTARRSGCGEGAFCLAGARGGETGESCKSNVYWDRGSKGSSADYADCAEMKSKQRRPTLASPAGARDGSPADGEEGGPGSPDDSASY